MMPLLQYAKQENLKIIDASWEPEDINDRAYNVRRIRFDSVSVN
jgi:hypothetical protein